MSVPAVAIRKMAELGLTASDIADLCELIETKPQRTPNAERQARFRARHNGVTSNVTDNALREPPIEEIIPQKPSEAKASSGVTSQRNGTRLAENWEPSEEDVAVATGLGLTTEEISREALGFRNYWTSRSRDARKLSWPKTWHNRCLDLSRRKREQGPRLVAGTGLAKGGGRGSTSFADLYVQRHGVAAE